MWKWLVIVLLFGRTAWAQPINPCTFYNPSDGILCNLVDGVTTGICAQNVCIRNYIVPGNGARTGTGTISSVGGTVTGVGTNFPVEERVGDVLTAGGQRVAIISIASGQSLSTNPAFAPALVAGTSFTFTNPIVRWWDENGNTVAVLDSRGLVAFGQAWADGNLTVVGATETAVGSVGKAVNITTGQGGPAGGSTGAGAGGAVAFTAGIGGSSAVVGLNGGQGASDTITGGAGGTNSAAGGTGGPGGYVALTGGPGGAASGTGATTAGSGGDVVVNGGQPGSAGATSGTPGRVILRGGTGNGNGDIIICDLGGITKIGSSATMQVNCANGNITKIRGVTTSWPSAQGAASTFFKNDGSGNLSWSLLTAADIPAAQKASGPNGAIQLSDGSANFVDDDANFHWDRTNHRLGRRNTSPAQDIDFAADDAAQEVWQGTTYGDQVFTTEVGSIVSLRAARGTKAAPVAVNTNGALGPDQLGTVQAAGYNGTTFVNGAFLQFLVDGSGAWTGTANPGKVCISTTASGSTTAVVNDCTRGDGTKEFTKTIAKYNGIATIGGGTPAQYATADLTTQGAAIAATTLYAVPSTGAGIYRVSFVATVTRAATTSSVLGGTNGFQIKYTDSDDSVVKTMPGTIVAGINTNNTNSTSTGAISGVFVANAKASTNIQYQIDYTSVGATAMQFNLHVRLEAL